MIVEPDFLDHWKTRLLVRLLGTELAPIYVLRLWAHCQQRKTDRFTGWKPVVLASVCRWDSDAQTLWDAMAATFIRFEGEELVVHGWAETNASLVSAWANGKLGGRPKKSMGYVEPKPTGNRPVIPPVTDRVTDREDREDREEKNREDKTEKGMEWVLEHGVSLPESLQTAECLAASKLWIQYKRERRSPYKPTGLATAVKQWAKEYTSADFPAAVQRSIANNYQGIYGNDNRNGGGRNGQLNPIEQRNSRIAGAAETIEQCRRTAERERREQAEGDALPFGP